MNKEKKYLYLPLEIVIREHDGKATLAREAAAAGWTVIIGPKVALYSICDQLPEGVFLIKSATPLEAEQIRGLKKAGHKVASHDEEGVVTFREFLGKNVRFGAGTIAEIDRIFFWGDIQQECFNEAYPDSAHKGHVTGSPRFEFWRDYAADVYAKTVREIQEDYGKYILIPSSFGLANNVLGGDMGVQLTKRHSGDLTKDQANFMTGQGEQNLVAFKEYMDFLPQIATRFPNTSFIVRPHPSEGHEVWHEFVRNFPNFSLVYEGSVTPWILGAASIFHFKSTTSIEAYIMGRSVTTYMPPLPPYMDRFKLEVPLAVSRVAETREELLGFIEEALKSEVPPAPGAVTGILKNWISIDPARSSSQRMLELLEQIMPAASTRSLQQPVENVKRGLHKKIEKALQIAGSHPSISKRLPLSLQRRIGGIAYGQRKSSGMDLAHTENVIRTIEKKSRSDAPLLRVSQFTDRIFMIAKDD